MKREKKIIVNGQDVRINLGLQQSFDILKEQNLPKIIVQGINMLISQPRKTVKSILSKIK